MRGRVALGAWLAVGCGWVPGVEVGQAAPPGARNRAACGEWVEHVNGLDACVSVTYDADNLCAGSESLPAEMAAYYRCLTKKAHCEGAEPRLTPEECVPPLVSLTPEPRPRRP